MTKINLTKTQKMALAVIVVAAVAAAALLVALPLMEPSGPDYAAVVDVKVYGPGWTIVAEDVGVENASALNALKTAGEREDFEIEESGGFISSINGTVGSMTEFWLFGINGTMAEVGANVCEVHDGDTVAFYYTDQYPSDPPGI
ncbi:MAG: DUF4430 domain-containing protein [Methanobacteriota archaeon]